MKHNKYKYWVYPGYGELPAFFQHTKEQIEEIAKNEERAKELKHNVVEYLLNKPCPRLTFTHEGAIRELNNLRKLDVKKFDEEIVQFNNVCSGFCKSMVPNINDAWMLGSISRTAAFCNRAYLGRAFELSFKHEKKVRPEHLFRNLNMAGGMPNIFLPSRAKTIYENFVPPGGTIYDYSFGWGSRMLAAVCSKNGYKYVGTDPNTETFNNVSNMLEFVKQWDPKVEATLHCLGSEELELPENSVDFAFSSPPYFDLEKYSNEATQSIVKYSNIEAWTEYYVKPTIRNCFKALKPGGRFAVNIRDFRRIKIEHLWFDAAIECGFEFEKKYTIKIQTRSGNHHKGVKEERGPSSKQGEPLYVFRKP